MAKLAIRGYLVRSHPWRAVTLASPCRELTLMINAAQEGVQVLLPQAKTEQNKKTKKK